MTTTTRPRPRTAAQTRLLAERREAERREAARRRAVRRGGGAVIGLLVLAIVAAVLASTTGGDEAPAASGTIVVPAHAGPQGGISVGEVSAPVGVTVFFDYMCPFCGRFEQANSAALDELVTSGKARVELRPMSFLDPQSDGSRFSTRAANALATVADSSAQHAWAFHRALFAHQPEEGTAGLSDEHIAQVAADAGVPADVVARFGDRTFEPWVADVTQQAFDSGVTGTPTVLVDGHVFRGDLYAEGALAQAVAQAAAP